MPEARNVVGINQDETVQLEGADLLAALLKDWQERRIEEFVVITRAASSAKEEEEGGDVYRTTGITRPNSAPEFVVTLHRLINNLVYTGRLGGDE